MATGAARFTEPALDGGGVLGAFVRFALGALAADAGGEIERVLHAEFQRAGLRFLQSDEEAHGTGPGEQPGDFLRSGPVIRRG